MYIGRNPGRARPLSRNVKRLMIMARESPENPDVQKLARKISSRDLLYCRMQGEIFMAAVDLDYDLHDFSEMFMNSQVAGLLDHSFSCAKGLEEDPLSMVVKLPILMKDPKTIAAAAVFLDEFNRDSKEEPPDPGSDPPGRTELITLYQYAYFLGYIYRLESLLHEESSRMVYGAFPEEDMKRTYEQMEEEICQRGLEKISFAVCNRLDRLLAGSLFQKTKRRTT